MSQMISAKDAARIVKCAAPFIKTLAADIGFSRSEKLVLIGPFFYKVRDFNSDTILKLLAENATKITQMTFDREPKTDLLKGLFSTNIIKTIRFDELGNFYEHVRTDHIEDIRATVVNKVKSFEGVSIYFYSL